MLDQNLMKRKYLSVFEYVLSILEKKNWARDQRRCYLSSKCEANKLTSLTTTKANPSHLNSMTFFGLWEHLTMKENLMSHSRRFSAASACPFWITPSKVIMFAYLRMARQAPERRTQ
eukprot:PhF_6_TR18890/c0_g1_i1/m.27518